MSINKVILKTATVSLLVLFVVTSYVFALVGFVAPRMMANLGWRMNSMGMVANAYLNMYRWNPTTENLYLAVDRMILANRSSQIVRHAPRLFNADDYDDVIAIVSQAKSEAIDTPSNMIYSFVVNEHDRLRVSYLEALVNRGRFTDAVFVLFDDIDTFYELRIPVYRYVTTGGPRAPLTPAAVEKLKHMLSRPTNAWFKVGELQSHNIDFWLYSAQWVSLMDSDFLSYINDFAAIWLLLSHPDNSHLVDTTDSRFRVADGFMQFVHAQIQGG